ncbi:hypothetical protein GGI05_007469, partial [Coemansia sp. RSA 2603]
LVRGQKERGVFSAQSEWSSELYEEVASRCQIADELSFSNATFVNPTLFHMLRQHREFNEATERELLKKKRDVADELERKRQQKMGEDQEEITNGLGSNPDQTNGKNEGDGDDSMLLAVDSAEVGPIELGEQDMEVDKTTVDDAIARLAGTASQAEDESSAHIESDAPKSNSNGAHTTDSTDVSNTGQEAGETEDDGASVNNNSKSDHDSDGESVDIDTSDDENESNTS